MVAEMNEKMIEAMKKFIDYRDMKTTIDRFAPYGWYKPPVALAWFIGYTWMLDEHSREIANSINELSRYIRNIEALNIIIEGCDDDTRAKMVVEFIAPFTTLAINMPYVISYRLIYSISHLCHQSNLTKDPKRIDKFPLEKDIDFGVADQYCSLWKCYKKLKIALEKINDNKFKQITKDFRNKYNHRYSINIEIGLTEFVKRVVKDDGKVIYRFGYTEPLKIDRLLPALKEQHANCLDAFGQYQKLINEQISALENWNKLEKQT
jgi:hypothetical protein